MFDNIANVPGGTDIVLDVSIYGGDSNKSLSLLDKSLSIDVSSGQILVHPRARARYFSYKIEVTAPIAVDWTSVLGEIEFYGAIARYKPSGHRQN